MKQSVCRNQGGPWACLNRTAFQPRRRLLFSRGEPPAFCWRLFLLSYTEGRFSAVISWYPRLCYRFLPMKLLLFPLKLFLKQHETSSKLKWQMHGSNFPSCRRWYRQICCWYQQVLSRAPVSHLECIAVSPLTCFFIALKKRHLEKQLFYSEKSLTPGL